MMIHPKVSIEGWVLHKCSHCGSSRYRTYYRTYLTWRWAEYCGWCGFAGIQNNQPIMNLRAVYCTICSKPYLRTFPKQKACRNCSIKVIRDFMKVSRYVDREILAIALPILFRLDNQAEHGPAKKTAQLRKKSRILAPKRKHGVR